MKPIVVFFLFASSVTHSQTITDYFKDFPFKPLDITVDSAGEHMGIDVDQKNAFINVTYDDADYGYEYGWEFSVHLFCQKR